jgi:hypothetical protein
MSKQLTELLVTVTGKAFGVLVEECDAMAIRLEFVRYVNNVGAFGLSPRYIVKFFEILAKSEFLVTYDEMVLMVNAATNWTVYTLEQLAPVYHSYIMQLVAVAKKLKCADKAATDYCDSQMIRGCAFVYAKKFVLNEADTCHKNFVARPNVSVSMDEFVKMINYLWTCLAQEVLGTPIELDDWKSTGHAQGVVSILRRRLSY